MDRHTVLAVAIAVGGVLAVSLAAATFTSTVSPDPVGTGGAGGAAAGPGSGLATAPPSATGPTSRLPAWFGRLLSLLLALLALATLGYLLVTRPREAVLLVAVAAATGLGLLLVVLLGSPTFRGLPSRAVAPNGSPLGGGSGGSVGEPIEVSLPSILLVLGIALGIAATVFALVRTAPDEPRKEHDDDDETRGAVGRVAGRAADRIESATGDAPVDNAVYRAWRDMTRLVGSGSRATTPGEFAEAAVEAGMEPGDVEELTRLFEDVRYGLDEPTPDREARALAVLRHIEAAYAPEATE